MVPFMVHGDLWLPTGLGQGECVARADGEFWPWPSQEWCCQILQWIERFSGPMKWNALKPQHLTYFIRTLNRTQNKDPRPCSAAEIRRGWSAGDSSTSVCNSHVWWLRLESPHLLSPFPTHCKSLKAKIIKVLALTFRGLIVISR